MPRSEVMQHFLEGENLGIVLCRQLVSENYSHALVTNKITDDSFVSNKSKERGYLFPLYLYPKTEGQQSLDDNQERRPNLNDKSVRQIAQSISLLFTLEKEGRKGTFAPIDILGYIYAVLHSPSYRKKYKEFLKINFPRIPFTSNQNLFLKLSDIGSELVALHLLESQKLGNLITTFPVPGDNSVTKVGEAKKQLKNVKNGKGHLYINKTQYFDGLPQDVWNFHIGGYQVCYKWLYDRKKAKRRLSQEDIEHYHKIVVALNETIRLMKEIDETIDAHGGWPIR